jgi:hypothetical protein
MKVSTRGVFVVAGAILGFLAVWMLGIWLVVWLMSERPYSCACPGGVVRDGWTSSHMNEDEFCGRQCTPAQAR